jgi:hypothetical protein
LLPALDHGLEPAAVTGQDDRLRGAGRRSERLVGPAAELESFPALCVRE